MARLLSSSSILNVFLFFFNYYFRLHTRDLLSVNCNMSVLSYALAALTLENAVKGFLDWKTLWKQYNGNSVQRSGTLYLVPILPFSSKVDSLLLQTMRSSSVKTYQNELK